MSARGGSKKDMLAVIVGLQSKVAELSEENRQLRLASEPKDSPDKRGAITWRRVDVEEVISEAESDARRTKRTHYVGAIGWPDGSQIYGDGTLGITDDREILAGLGTIFATCEPHQTTRHS